MDLIAIAIVAFILGLPILTGIGVLVVRAGLSRLDRRTSTLERETADLRAAVMRLSTAPSQAEAKADAPVDARTPTPLAAPAEPPVADPGRQEAEPDRADVDLEGLDELLGAPTTPPEAPAPWVPPTPSSAVGSADLERTLGTRVAVWLGAVALTLAGAFLVKYTVEHGLLGPGARVALGLGFGGLLVASAEWMRRKSDGIAQGLAASGVAVVFAALLAAVNLYDLIPPMLGFFCMAATTAGAVVLSLRHGQLVAVLGLLGGLATPLWIDTQQPRPWMLCTYLLTLQLGLLLVTRRRGWWPVAGLSLLGSLAWGALWIGEMGTHGDGTLPLGVFLLSSIGAFVFHAATDTGPTFENEKLRLAMVWCGAGLGTLLLASLVGVTGFGWPEWGYLGLLGAGCLYLGRRDARYEPLAWIAAFAGLALLTSWSFAVGSAGARFWLTTAAYVALFAGGSTAALVRAAQPQRFAALAGASATLALIVGYSGLHGREFLLPWGAQALLLAAAFTALAVALRRGDLVPEAQRERTLAVVALTVSALVVLAAPMELERAWISVAWAAMIPAAGLIATRYRMPALDRVAIVLAGLVAGRLLFNGAVLRYPIGDGLVWNWLLYGYGIPIVAALTGAYLFRRLERETAAQVLETLAIALGAAFVILEIRHGFSARGFGRLPFTLVEWGTYTIAGLGYALGLLFVSRRTGSRLYRLAGAVVAIAALTQGVLAQGLVQNPLWSAQPVGSTLIVNRLLWVFGLPAILFALVARSLHARGEVVASRACGIGALAFGFATISLEVRQAFHGAFLDQGSASNAEMYTYSLVWILFATALLVAGILTRGTVLRYGSAAIMLLAVGKVFLVDTAHLEDLYRVLSLLGLGVSLMLLAWLYQRFVFGGRSTSRL